LVVCGIRLQIEFDSFALCDKIFHNNNNNIILPGFCPARVS
jgi:hypothetical protein